MMVPYAFAKAHSVLPAGERDGRLLLWVTRATPPAAIGEVRRSLGRDIQPELVEQQAFDAALHAAYAEPRGEAASIVDEVQDTAELGRLLQDLPEVEDLLDARHDAPIIRMLNALLSQAVSEGASDV
ncbi:MAG TPA: type II secretion system protein GspE, partial [Burkholderiales bacterium]|nr:type II secretion system protein GspE [Burkholderiales bacterium]